MSQESINAQDIAYSREGQIVAHYRTLAERKDMTGEEASQALQDFCSHYQRLVEDSKLLTSVGDRLQRKLKSANLMLREQSDEIKRINGEVQLKNAELQETIDELTRAKVSRRATTLLLLVAIGLFLLSEIPESYYESYFAQFSWGGIVTWGIKFLIALLLAPIQSLIEVRLLKQVAKQKKKAQDEAAALQPVGGAALPPDMASRVTPAVVPTAAAGEAGAAGMSVAARKKAEAAARRESGVAGPAAPTPVVVASSSEAHGDANMATQSVAARKKAEAAARKAAAEAAAPVEAPQQQS